MPTRTSALLCFLALPLAAPALAAKIDLSTPEGASLALRKIQCSTRDGEASTFYWNGEVLSRVEGEADRRLFKVMGMNIRQCITVKDPVKGSGWRLITREALFYLDPKTGEILKTWQNPWTGKSVEVLHIANDPVNQQPVFLTGRDGRPLAWNGNANGDFWWMTSTIPLFYDNPLAGSYQKYIGGTYHATEMFNFMGDLSDLTDSTKPTAEVRVGWVRLSNWLPWMEMGGRQGLIYFHTAGRKLESYDQMPEVMRRAIDEHFPEYRTPPPADDTRPNETSWSYFRKKVPPPSPPAAK